MGISESFSTDRGESEEKKQSKDEGGINLAYGKTTSTPSMVSNL